MQGGEYFKNEQLCPNDGQFPVKIQYFVPFSVTLKENKENHNFLYTFQPPPPKWSAVQVSLKSIENQLQNSISKISTFCSYK